MTARSPLRVLLITLSFGAGHQRAAAAVAGEIRALHPGATVETVDALASAHPLFRALYAWPYWLMLRYAPGIWRRLFESRLRHHSRHTAPEWLFRFGCRATFRAIEAFDPDVIVAAEVAAAEISDLARRSKRTHAAIVAMITDRQAEPAWVRESINAYAVADGSVAAQLRGWGAEPSRISVCGIPVDSRFQSTRTGHPGVTSPSTPLVLVMGGGMGPTRMDTVVSELARLDVPMRVVAVAGRDQHAERRLRTVSSTPSVHVDVRAWVDDVPALMREADVLVTKPGGVTTAEAAACGVPMVLFNAIPGPEEVNAARFVEGGAAVFTATARDTAGAVAGLLRDQDAAAWMRAGARAMAAPEAARQIAALAIRMATAATRHVVFLTIANGAGHTRVAEAIGAAVSRFDSGTTPVVLDVADYMSWTARFTHVTLYLWLVRHAPAVWARIDRYQKRQTTTSPEWYYRRHCRALFDALERLAPVAIVATEVGCCEIAALAVRDLRLPCPLVAVNGEYDADRAWVRPEVSAYSVATTDVAAQLIQHGAPRQLVHVWGVPLDRAFTDGPAGAAARQSVCAGLDLDPRRPIALLSGGSEGLGRPETLVAALLAIEPPLSVIVLSGRNDALRRRCERLALAAPERVRVLGWTPEVAALMASADVLVSKLGHTFDEAIAMALPIVSLPPPPGSEEAQYALLDEWGVGRGVTTVEGVRDAVRRLVTDAVERSRVRRAAARRRNPSAAAHVARWIVEVSQ